MKVVTMIESMQAFTASLPPMLQWVGVLLVGAIPFVESYFGSVVGVLGGLNPAVAIAAAVAGNIVSMLIVVRTGCGPRLLRGRRPRNRPPAGKSCAPRSTNTAWPGSA